MVQGANEIRDCVLRKNKTSVHVVAGIKKDENARPGERGSIIRWSIARDPWRRTRTQIGSEGFDQLWFDFFRLKVLSSSRGLALFSEGSNLLPNPILENRKIARSQASYVVALLVRHRHIQLHHIDGDVKDRTIGFAILRRRANCRRGECTEKKH